MATKGWAGLGLFALLALGTSAWGQTSSPPASVQIGTPMGSPTQPFPSSPPSEALPLSSGPQAAPAPNLTFSNEQPSRPPTLPCPPQQPASPPDALLTAPQLAGFAPAVAKPGPGGPQEPDADHTPVARVAALEAQELDVLRSENADIRKKIEELTKKYSILAIQEQKREKAEEAQREKEARKRRSVGLIPSAPRKREPMYHIGLFWWRDDIKEIAGRGPYYPDMEPAEHRISEQVTFGDGLNWRSEDKYFTLTFHDLTQLDLREPIQQGDPLHGGFDIPRQRWYFNGTIGDYVSFVTSINRGYSTLDVLDSYADYAVNREWLNFRVGRFKMPSQYEYIDIAEGDLLGPERSIYVANYAANRQLGAMAHGYLFERRIHYYLAVGGGPRRSFEQYNSSMNYFAYVDFRPFQTWNDTPWLKGLHLVTTYNFGEMRGPLAPLAIRTMNQMSGSEQAAFVSPTVLEFNPNVFENGPRAAWGFEPVYYYKSFGFLGSIQGGYESYSTGNLSGLPGFQNAKNEFLGVNSPIRTHVPIYGWSAGAWYFLTGEEITRRRFLVEPRRPFGYYDGRLNPGAIELFSHVSNFQMGSNAFTAGLVNPALWTNRATTLDVGFNWYLTHFVKFTFDYQHTFLGNSVILNAGTGQRTGAYDMFMFRTQLYF